MEKCARQSHADLNASRFTLPCVINFTASIYTFLMRDTCLTHFLLQHLHVCPLLYLAVPFSVAAFHPFISHTVDL